MKFKANDVFVFVARNENFQCGYVQGGQTRKYSIPVIIRTGIPKKDWTCMVADDEVFKATDGDFKLIANTWQEIRRES